MENNIEFDEKKNWVKIKIDSSIFTPKQVVVTANQFKDNSWIVMDTDSEGNVLVKILPKKEKNESDLREMGLDFQTNLISTTLQSRRNMPR